MPRSDFSRSLNVDYFQNLMPNFVCCLHDEIISEGNDATLLCEMTIESIGKSFVTFFQRNHALVSKAKLLL